MAAVTFNRHHAPLCRADSAAAAAAGGAQPSGQPAPPLPQAGVFLGDLLDHLFANFGNVRVNVDTGGQGPM